MNNNPIELAQHSIHHVHELIHRVFTDTDGSGAATIAPLMDAFAKDFSMVATSGVTVDRAQVEQLFRRNVGGGPGLEIVISDLHTVWQEGETIALSYTETHRQGENVTSRVSVAILRVQADRVEWQYLHETAFTPTNG
ncbi:DUF4440 domain-containing protein [Pseudomonas sp. MPR-ANC1]|uniref:DUF4440 domain-containing protein n=1 Tax=Pseudomonas sp. MPR-ANC1 TaxID=2075548 RepID=UPI000CD31561|nr:DUF4440 domain-containing protein [Pseudomonas sp. MPR-ANC1]POA46346.1 DUF4440 domain-containing protein [Pseudomonas sp. MPR-ANC1]